MFCKEYLRFIEDEKKYIEMLIFFIEMCFFYCNLFNNISFFCKLKKVTFFV